MLDFPSSPVDGEIYPFGNYRWRYDLGAGWTQIPAAGAGTVAWYEVGGVIVLDTLELPGAEPDPWYELTYI